jgi:hypothetical protein
MSQPDDVNSTVSLHLQAGFPHVAVLPGGVWSVGRGTARVFIRVDHRPAGSIVRLTCPVVSGAAASPELFEYVATHADDFVFGHLSCERSEDDAVTVFLSHVLLGDHLQELELTAAVAGVLDTADQIDGRLAARFDGREFRSRDG